MRDPETGNSKGYAFINFASFEASDAAIEAMNGQHLCNRPISVSYAFKKEARGERHGTGEGFNFAVSYILVMFKFALLCRAYVGIAESSVTYGSSSPAVCRCPTHISPTPKYDESTANGCTSFDEYVLANLIRYKF